MQAVSSNAVYNAIFDGNNGGRRLGNIGLIGGCDGFDANKIGDFIDNVLCGSNGDGTYGKGGIVGGSIYVSGNNMSLNIPDNWYNFVYIPHRIGFDTSSAGDNRLYGTMFLTELTSNTSNIYLIHRIGGINYGAWVK